MPPTLSTKEEEVSTLDMYLSQIQRTPTRLQLRHQAILQRRAHPHGLHLLGCSLCLRLLLPTIDEQYQGPHALNILNSQQASTTQHLQILTPQPQEVRNDSGSCESR